MRQYRMADEQDTRRLDRCRRWAMAASGGVLFLLAVTLVRNAWLTDDCYITFRTIWNFCHGFGLRWNPAERVQTFTHPLWMIVLTPVYFLTGKAWLTAWIAGFGCTMATAFLVFRRAADPIAGLAGLILLLASRAVTDFALAGLENPLSWLLLVWFFHSVHARNGTPEPLKIGLAAGLIILNRLDHALFVIPVLAAVVRSFDRRELRRLLLGFAPMAVWFVFATGYFGSPLPNTFFAKAVTGLPRPVLLGQGAAYFADSLVNDYATLPVIGLGVALAFRPAMRRLRPFAVGMLAYLGYVAWIGGDFMTGRFFADSYVVAVLLILASIETPWRVLAVATVIAAISLLHPHHPQKIGPDYYRDRAGREREIYPAGIVDEKGMAWQRSSLHSFGSRKPVVSAEETLARAFLEDGSGEPRLEFQVAVGLYGYTSGPGVHIIDRLGLTDPLLARLPARTDVLWRIGHHFRWVPEGYPESVLSGTNRVRDPGLVPLLDDLFAATRAPLFSPGRWRAILRLHLGLSAAEVDREFYRRPPEGAFEGTLGGW